MDYKQAIVDNGIRMYHSGLTVETWGNITLRDPESGLIYLTPSGMQYTTIRDEEAIEALFLLSRNEGIIPAIESSHALAQAIKVARTGITGSVLVNLSGRGDKDLDFVVEHYGYGPGLK